MSLINLRKGISFKCEQNETILESALRNGIFLNYSCKKGNCFICKVRVLKGDVTTSYTGFKQNEIKSCSDDYILTCITNPLSDLDLDVEDLSNYGLKESTTFPVKINEIKYLTEEIILVSLRVAKNQNISFIPGQYLDVIWNGYRRSYSIANEDSSNELELIIKKYPNGIMSDYWFNKAKIDDLLRVESPKGTFFLRNHPEKDTLIFLATGTGISPIISILESVSNKTKLSYFKRIILIWGMKYQKDIFWSPKTSNIEFMTVLSSEFPNHNKKYVQDSIDDLYVVWSKSVVYACGSINMIQAAFEKCIQAGLSETDFFSDAFLSTNQ
jgi:CDP-4-dehydro-6-deoxyglucose reductase